jgi:predicted nuclease of predicted toxin-antitoxin system
MALRWMFDECCDEDVAKALLIKGLDIVTVTSLGRKGLSDEDQLQFALQQNRVLYTTDKHFLQLAADYQAKDKMFGGIVYHASGSRSKRRIIDAIELMDGVYSSDEMMNRVEFI